MSDEHPRDGDGPDTSIRPARPQPDARQAPSQPAQGQMPYGTGQGAPGQGVPGQGAPGQAAPGAPGPRQQHHQGAAQGPPQGSPQGPPQGPPQGWPHPPPQPGQPSRGQPGQPPNGPASAGQPAYAPPAHGHAPSQGGGQRWGAPGGPTPAGDAPRRHESRRSGLGLGLLAGALVLGLAGGFGGAWLQGGGGGGDVDAAEINTGGLDLQNLVSVQTVADKAMPSVVKIEGIRSEGSGSGSGVIISEDGMILTNYHVAWLGDDGGELEVLFNDGTSAAAEIVGTDPSMDIAVIKAEDVSDLDALEYGKAEDVRVGQAVIALGSPYGLQSTVTAGIISSTNRPVNVPGMDDPETPMVFPGLQTDAAINPGNSGGALVNIKGELVGMNSANKLAANAEGSSGDLGSIGIGWAIPINVLEPIVEQLKAGEDPTHAWLGIDPGDAREKGLARGAEVTGFLDGGNAEDAGVEEGDIVTAIDDYSISNGLGLITTALQYRPGDTVTLHVVRDGEPQEIEVEMAEKGNLFDD